MAGEFNSDILDDQSEFMLSKVTHTIVLRMYILHLPTDEGFHKSTEMFLGFKRNSNDEFEFADGSTLPSSVGRQIIQANVPTVTRYNVSMLCNIFP